MLHVFMGQFVIFLDKQQLWQMLPNITLCAAVAEDLRNMKQTGKIHLIAVHAGWSHQAVLLLSAQSRDSVEAAQN